MPQEICSVVEFAVRVCWQILINIRTLFNGSLVWNIFLCRAPYVTGAGMTLVKPEVATVNQYRLLKYDRIQGHTPNHQTNPWNKAKGPYWPVSSKWQYFDREKNEPQSGRQIIDFFFVIRDGRKTSTIAVQKSGITSHKRSRKYNLRQSIQYQN